MKDVQGDDVEDYDLNVWNASAVILDIDQGSWADRSPLHEAASQGRLLTVRKLISQGCNVNVLTIDHVSPLHEASLSDHVACTRALIEAGANVNVTSIDGVTPLYNACSSDSVRCAEALLENGAKFQVGLFQPSPIHVAASKGCHATLEALIAWGADVDYNIPHMGTPLYVACICKEFQCARILLNGGEGIYTDSPAFTSNTPLGLYEKAVSATFCKLKEI